MRSGVAGLSRLAALGPKGQDKALGLFAWDVGGSDLLSGDLELAFLKDAWDGR